MLRLTLSLALVAAEFECGGEFSTSVVDVSSPEAVEPHAQPSTESTALKPPEAHSCDHCEGSYPFKADGVNIHSCPSTSCTVVGDGYRSHRQATICQGDYIQNGFGHIEDRNTGVRGWALLKYVTAVCD